MTLYEPATDIGLTEAIFTGHSQLGAGATQARTRYPERSGRALGCDIVSGGEGGAKVANAEAGVTYAMGWPNIGNLLAHTPAVDAGDLAAKAQVVSLDYGINENTQSAAGYRHAMRAAICLARMGSRFQGAHASVGGTGGFATVGSAGSQYPGTSATGGPGASRVRGPGGVGDTLTLTLPSWFPGGEIDVIFISTNTTGSNMTITVDGSSAGAHDARTPTDGSGYKCATVKRLTALSSGARVIVFTITAITGGTGSYFDSYAMVADEPPLVVLSEVAPGNNEAPQTLNDELAGLTTEFTDGKVVVYERFADFIDNGPAADLLADGLHFNDSGHAVAATGFTATVLANASLIPARAAHGGRVS